MLNTFDHHSPLKSCIHSQNSMLYTDADSSVYHSFIKRLAHATLMQAMDSWFESNCCLHTSGLI